MIVFTIPSFISILFTTLSYFFIERKNLKHQKENNQNKQRTKNTKKRKCTSTTNYTGIRNSYRYEIDQSQTNIPPYSILWHVTIDHKQVATYIQKMRGSPTCFKEVAKPQHLSTLASAKYNVYNTDAWHPKTVRFYNQIDKSLEGEVLHCNVLTPVFYLKKPTLIAFRHPNFLFYTHPMLLFNSH